jgi:hypothetical protein
VADQRDLFHTDPIAKYSQKAERSAQTESEESRRSAGPHPPVETVKFAVEFISRRAPLIWLLVGLSLLILNIPLEYSLNKVSPSPTLWLYRTGGYLGFILGAAALWIGAYSWGSEKSSNRMDRLQRGIAFRLGISEGQIPLVAGSFGFALLGAAGAGDKPLMFNPTVALVSWGIGIVLAVAGFWSGPSEGRNIRSAAAWTLLFSFSALLIRLPELNLPPFLGDESSGGMDALLFLRGSVNSFFRPVGWHSFPGLYFFLEAVSIQLLGRTILAVRLSSVVIGALTVGALYLSARALFGHRTGVIAAILLAVSPFHIFSSHIGLNNVWDALGYTVFAGAIWHAWRSGRWNAFLLAGLALGLSQYFYSTSQLLLFLALGWMIAAFFLDRPRFTKNIGGWIGMWIAAGVAVLPIAFFLIARPSAFSGHTLSRSIFNPGWLTYTMQATGASVWGVLWDQLLRGFGAFTFVPSASWFAPGAPLLRPVEAAFFLGGLILLALKPRDLRSWLLLGWVGIFGIIGTLSEGTPTSQRYIGSAPVCALLVAFALVEIRSQLDGLIPFLGKWAVALSIALVLFVAVDNLNFSFKDYFPNTRFGGKHDFEGMGGIVANQVVALLQERKDPYEVVYLSGIPAESRPAKFLIPNYKEVVFPKPYGASENPKPEGSRLLFIVPAGREGDLHRVMEDYPGGKAGKSFNWDGRLIFLYYDVVIPKGKETGYWNDDPALPWTEVCRCGPIRLCLAGSLYPSKG